MSAVMPMPTLVRGDARRLPLAADTVDLVITSPPYFGLRAYTDDGEYLHGQIGDEPTPAEYLDALIAATREWVRVLRPSGSLFVNLGDKYSTYEHRRAPRELGPDSISHQQLAASPRDARYTRNAPAAYGIPYKSLMGLPWRYALRCVDELGLILRAEIVWSKPNGMPESCRDRVRRSHETWFHLTRCESYYENVDAIREPHTMRAQRRYSGRPEDRTPRPNSHPPRTYQPPLRDAPGVDGHPLGRLPGSVWEIASQPLNVPDELGEDHYAAYPMEWPRRLILGWCPPGGVVCDPFGGTGTTALVAAMLGCTGISVDLSASYQRIASWRATDPRERARAAGLDPAQVAAIARPLPGQGDLLDLLTGEAAS